MLPQDHLLIAFLSVKTPSSCLFWNNNLIWNTIVVLFRDQ